MLYNQNPDLLPTRAHDTDAGLDLKAAEAISLPPHESRIVSTGTTIDLPAGQVALVCPRSGLAARYGITVLNSPGIIDPGYRGEIKVILINHSNAEYAVQVGDRVAQLLILNTPHTPAEQTSTRGTGGLGSTGK